MKNNFHAYYRPTEEEFQSLWENCLFVLDANVLLNIYRYSPDTRKQFMSILDQISSRLWIPNHAAKEYHNNRLNVIRQQEQAYDKLIDQIKNYSTDIKKIITKIQNELNSYKKHPFIDIDKYSDQVKDFLLLKELNGIISELENNKVNHPSYTFSDDNLMDELTLLLDGKVGEKCSSQELETIYKKGKLRYSREIPPGYADAPKKDKDDKTKLKKYGDLIIWFQIVKKAKVSLKPIIFVTDDEKKGDWFWRIKNSNIGPRPELIEEMKEKANVSFYLYSANKFMEYSRKYLKFDVDKEAIEEVRDTVIFLDEQTIKEDLKNRQINNFYHDIHDFSFKPTSILKYKPDYYKFEFLRDLNNIKDEFENITDPELPKSIEKYEELYERLIRTESFIKSLESQFVNYHNDILVDLRKINRKLNKIELTSDNVDLTQEMLHKKIELKKEKKNIEELKKNSLKNLDVFESLKGPMDEIKFYLEEQLFPDKYD